VTVTGIAGQHVASVTSYCMLSTHCGGFLQSLNESRHRITTMGQSSSSSFSHLIAPPFLLLYLLISILLVLPSWCLPHRSTRLFLFPPPLLLLSLIPIVAHLRIGARNWWRCANIELAAGMGDTAATTCSIVFIFEKIKSVTTGKLYM